MSDDKGPLSRWSERKLAARRAGEAPAEKLPAEAARPPVPAGDEAEAPVLPPVETLDASSDYTVFLGKNVPEALTRAALRKLWTSDPVLANLDGLNHYDDDYNVIDRAITLAETDYDPVRGFLRGADDSGHEVAESESAETPDLPQTEALSDNAAAVDGAADAPRQVAAAEPGAPEADSPSDPKK